MDVSELRAAATASGAGASTTTGWGSVLAGLGLALVAAVAVGLGWSALVRPDPAARLAPGPAEHVTVVPTTAVSRGSDRVAWAEMLAELDARRAESFARGSAVILEEVYAAGSPALAQERERLQQLAAAGVTARGLRHSIVHASVVDTAPGIVVLAVRDHMPPYDLVGADGEIVQRRSGRGEREWLVTVVPADSPEGEWRISRVELAGG